MARIQVIITLDDADRCNGCALLTVSKNPDLMGECLVGHWYDDEALDIEASEGGAGELVYIRPASCREENEVI